MPPSTQPTLRLRKPVERAVREGHPWVYRDAVAGDAPPGAIATLLDARGDFVARGVADGGPIALRVLTTRDEEISTALLADRVARAAQLRERVVPAETDAYRLLHGEGDRLPGFVCDVYGSVAVLKTDGAGALALRETIVDALKPVLDARGVQTLLLRASGRSASAGEAPGEGGDEAKGVRATKRYGPDVPDLVSVRERGMILLADLWRGQKTGLFLDQRESRAYVRRIARGLRVLNLYSYTGGFSVAAGLGGALRVESVDAAPPAIALAERTYVANGLDASTHKAVAADVPAHLANLSRNRARYDLIVADPPSFAPREESVPAALNSYRALHAACVALLPTGGYYLAASCSSHVHREAFEGTVLEGARRARRTLQLIDAWGQPADHPRPAAFPEGAYLKALLYRVE